MVPFEGLKMLIFVGANHDFVTLGFYLWLKIMITSQKTNW